MNKFKLFSLLVGMCMVLKLNAQTTPDTFVYKVGSWEVILLSEVQQNGSESILIGATPEQLTAYVPNGTFPNAVNAFLIKTPERNILVDTGYGRKLGDNLNSVGVTSDQIDVLLITHMHGDHIGGMIKDGKVAFPNAEVYIPRPEYDYWMNKEIMNQQSEKGQSSFKNAQATVEAYKDKVHLFEPNSLQSNATVLFQHISPVAAYGHTPGHTAYLLNVNNEKLLIWGDLTHAMAIQMPHPEIAVTYDVNPEDAIVARESVLKYVDAHSIPIAGMHIAYPGMGIIQKAGIGYLFTPVE